MTTIKIKPTHASQGAFVVIEKKDFDSSKHELLEGESLDDDAPGAGVDTPTLAELLASRDQLLARKDQLEDLELQLNQRTIALDEREHALAAGEQRLAELMQVNEAEAQRLRDEAASLQAVKDAVAAQVQAAAATAAAEKPAKAAKA